MTLIPECMENQQEPTLNNRNATIKGVVQLSSFDRSLPPLDEPIEEHKRVFKGLNLI